MITHRQIHNRAVWNDAIRQLPGASILQTWEWGQIKAAFGWEPHYFLWEDEDGKVAASALLLVRSISFLRLKTAYVPQGPLLDWQNRDIYQLVIGDLADVAREMGAFSLKIDPEVISGFTEDTKQGHSLQKNADAVVNFLTDAGFVFSSQQIQFRNTAWLKLDKQEEELLADMKQKTRYNIRLAGRKGVCVREGTAEDIPPLYKMYLETSVRDGFIIRPFEYYEHVWRTFIDAGMALPLIAEVDGEPIAGLMLFHFGGRSWYLYGMSTEVHREKMPNYLLQWEAIKHSKALGCEVYDLWGAPDVFDESDHLWGVYRFKQGLGAVPVRRIGAYDLPLMKNTYKIFIEIIPRVQAVLRKIRRNEEMQELQ